MTIRASGKILCLLLVTLLISAATAWSDPLFNSWQFYPYRTYDTACGDLNGDGWLDLMVNKDTSVLLGNSDGTFSYVEGSADPDFELETFILTDLNLDGTLDLAMVHDQLVDCVSISMGNGDGTFNTPLFYQAEGYPQEITAADLNNDGRPDLITANTGRHNISVMLGNGDGTFSDSVEYATGDHPRHLATGDFDGDGALDLALVNGSNLSTFLGNGDGSFQDSVDYDVGVYPVFVTAGDLDDDATLDLVVVNNGSNFISVLRGNGDGTFAEQNYPVGGDGRSATLYDINGDGLLDIAVAGVEYEGDDCIAVMFSMGDGTYQRRWDRFTAKPHSVIYGHLNIDGYLDMIVDRYPEPAYSSPSYGYSVHLGTADSTFVSPENLTVGYGPTAIAMDHIDDDQNLDLVITHAWFSDDNAWIMLGNGDGTFQAPDEYWMGKGPQAVVLADFDNDGNKDMAAGGWNDPGTLGYVTVRLGNGDGSFGQQKYFLDAWMIFSLDAGDFNGDGYQDLAVGCRSSSTVSRVAILINDGEGGFQVGPIMGNYPFVSPYHVNKVEVAIGDLDQNGTLDVVAVSSGNSYDGYGQLDLFRGNGDGTFQNAVQLGAGFETYFQDVAIGDLNSDGIPELVVNDNNRTIVFLGDPALNYLDRKYYEYQGNSVIIADLDGDGSFDVANSTEAHVNVYLNNGDATLRYSMGHGIEQDAVALAAGDLNNDGRQDLVTANYLAHTISLLFGQKTTGIVSADLTCLPSSGTLPFPAQFTATMTNNYQGQARRIQYQLDVTLANGPYYSNWRRGWQNVMAGDIFSKSWWQTLPAVGTLEGLSQFQLIATDITPPPWNQPPYPPAGDTDTAACTITGVMP